MQALSRLFLIAFCLAAALYVVLAEYWLLRVLPPEVEHIEDRVAHAERFLPWGGYIWTRIGHTGTRYWQSRPAFASKVLKRASRTYAFQPVWWEHQARIAAHFPEQDKPEGLVAAHLAAATGVQPHNRETAWRAAQLAMQTGHYETAEVHLRQWLEGRPGRVERALFVARRWIRDPKSLVERILPEGREFRVAALEFAVRREDLELGEYLWGLLDSDRGLDDPAFQSLVELYLRADHIVRAQRMWAEQDPYYEPNGFPDGTFQRELRSEGPFAWNLGRIPRSVTLTRDTEVFWVPPASLRISFDGSENVRLTRPWIQVPVSEPGEYRLRGRWRAAGLTTRSLPYIHVLLEQPREGVDSVGVPGSDFDWQDWSIDFEVDSPNRIVRMTVRRNSTDAFDRYIEGGLWIDDIELIRLPLTPDPVEPENG